MIYFEKQTEGIRAVKNIQKIDFKNNSMFSVLVEFFESIITNEDLYNHFYFTDRKNRDDFYEQLVSTIVLPDIKVITQNYVEKLKQEIESK